MELADRDFSPRSDIIVEHYFNPKTYEREVWLAPADKEADRVLLYKHARSVGVMFSPDEQWLIVNDFAGSNIAYPVLFKRGTGVNYSEIDRSISEKVWQLVGKDYPIVLSDDFGHRYVQVIRWTRDSRSFLVKAFGHLDSATIDNTLDPWLCVFTLDGFRATLDLSLMNRGALHPRAQ
jgi:hypothetical protein